MLLSVICPVYNARPEFLIAAIRSVMDQSRGRIAQFIIINDCSNAQETIECLNSISTHGPQFAVLHTPQNMGPAGARNIGLAHAQSDWVGFIDADDLWPMGKLDDVEAIANARPHTQWIVGECLKFTSNDQIPAAAGHVRPETQEYGLSPVSMSSPDLTRHIILKGLHLGACVIRRSLIQRMGSFDTRANYGEDILFLTNLSLLEPIDLTGKVAYFLRRQGTSMMRSSGRLSAKYASGPELALRDTRLRNFRKEIRWWLYSVYKDVAANNLINGLKGNALRFALKAFLLDPREIGDLSRFLGLLFDDPRGGRDQRLKKYSGAERVKLDQNGHFVNDADV